MKTIKIILLAILCTISANAQQTFYEQLKANGNDAVYTTFYRYNATSEYYTPGEQGEEINIKLLEVKGIPIGFKAYSVKTGKYVFGFDEVQNYGRVDHYPITKMMKHKYDSETYAMIDGSMYKFQVDKDGILKPVSLWEVYVLKRPKAMKQDTEEKKVTKKKKKKGLFSRFKNVGKGGSNSEKKYLRSLDIVSIVNTYETKMSAKQKAYQLTSKDKSDRAKIEKFRKEGKDFVKRYNDSIYNSPKEVENRRKWTKINAGTRLIVKNNKSTTIWISSSSNNFSNTKIDSGREGAMDCRSDLYYFFSDKKGAKGVKFYSANSACGSSATIN
ncbi:hypothetical protein H2O64_04475 [Kordia sp. YSTF-M3]|uniref:Uncharacterized protein n=1 Tax=Kordia aestuariivivens TaxID=2759037 RepID=A0ABR7Q5Z5_9FLAO|nr:hypothetical protein [Kordia aestuariivivens]MBC8753913.1 hypothetical protein [Kordia aestuariivivens]